VRQALSAKSAAPTVSLTTAAPILQHAVGFDERRGLFGELVD
jgi:hypothetical protein